MTPRRILWSVPSYLEKGDFVAIYRTKPDEAIHDIWVVDEPPMLIPKGDRDGLKPGYQAYLKRIASLNKPLERTLLAKHRRTRQLPILRKNFQGMSEITHDWPVFRDLIVEDNPGLRKKLEGWAD